MESGCYSRSTARSQRQNCFQTIYAKKQGQNQSCPKIPLASSHATSRHHIAYAKRKHTTRVDGPTSTKQPQQKGSVVDKYRCYGRTASQGTHKAFATAEAHSHQDIRIAFTRW